MREIRGDAKTIRALLSGSKFAVDYYQREYKWERKQVAELLDDLAEKFVESYEAEHERKQVEKYGHYFLGSIIISDKDGHKFVIDGQQRLTTLTLLLIFLQRRINNAEQKGQLAELIFSQKYGQKSFNIDVPDRTKCMDALYNGEAFDDTDQSEAVANIVGRYRDIEELFPEEVDEKALPYFIDWLVENVHLVEITAYSDEDAYSIFETMNDRGLSLTPTDMLKGYILANIDDVALRNKAASIWKTHVAVLTDFGKEEDADAIKAWLRAQHAETIRERKRDAQPLDFDRIGTEFHRWIKDNDERLNLNTGNDFYRFIDRDFDFYARQYLRLRKASEEIVPGLETIYYNAQHNFTLQYPILLAAITAGEPDDELLRKYRIVGAYLDIFLARRIWNFRAIDRSTVEYAMFLLIKAIRRRSSVELIEILQRRLEIEEERFATHDLFALHGQNRRQIHHILARMTDFVEVQSGQASHYKEYISRSGTKGYEVEHIWANMPDRHRDEFGHPSDFASYRNRVGGLLLLPKSFNASYGAMPFDQKRSYYDSQNLLARSLHENAYDHNPGFRRFISESGLDFKPHAQFRRVDLDQRTKLYQDLAELVWNPARLENEARAD